MTNTQSTTRHHRRGIPTARRVDHVAITVPSLDEAIRLLTDVLGGELVYRLPPLSRDDDYMAERLDVHPRASATIAMVRFGLFANIELFEYTAPDQVRTPPRPVDAGYQRLGLGVDDVDRALAALEQHGVRPASPVWTAPPDHPDAGTRLVRLHGCAGVNLELSSAPADRHFGAAVTWSNRDDGLPAATAVPGLRSVDRIGYTVDDLDLAVAFFVDVIGAEPLSRTGARDPGEHGLPELPARVRTDRATLRLGPTDKLELWQFAADDARRRRPRNSDIGGCHLAIAVDDVDAAAAYLTAVGGCTQLGAPETLRSGPLTGDRWVYLRSPIGLYLEVVNMPDGALPYERTTSARRRSAAGFHWWDR
ncbi:VOC family protein [Micromonospora sp. LOL_015]|uniref:VOC family protein n=1 Tax=Micromonospora sp. LOL_015 TaxID=3345416 RepID=UPI003A8B8CDF